jgi:hypothetical protein
MLTKAFDGFKSGDEVTLHFQGKRQMKTNKIALFFSSKLFQKIFETNCDCTTNPLQEYNILCPGKACYRWAQNFKHSKLQTYCDLRSDLKFTFYLTHPSWRKIEIGKTLY